MTEEAVSFSDKFLNDCWVLYFHDPDDNDWEVKSYQRMHTVSTVEDWVQLDKTFHEYWQNGMYFLMREHILPMWEDDNNNAGGCLSFKVNKPEAKEYWFHLGSKALGEVLKKHEIGWDKVNGVSISPKRNFCILRVWVASSEYATPDMFHLETPHYSQVMYKPHTKQKDYDQKPFVIE